ncbi:hypothetical protein [Chitinophaga rhizophila]|uniref:Uncharacterized protein n=1 Tax=Chitinophaga rhizophila TaxID=2866212 RepID=A0ABS7GCM2_9BACT|nr:hypothetical protein [Chitinophaga rhizophila]MBW8685035.1 hypothetical protein [Chitinophaga rhizophila]
MEITSLKKHRNNTIPKLKYTIDYNMRDYSDTPFFKQKLARAKASIAKAGLPDMREMYKAALSVTGQ